MQEFGWKIYNPVAANAANKEADAEETRDMWLAFIFAVIFLTTAVISMVYPFSIVFIAITLAAGFIFNIFTIANVIKKANR